MVDVAGTLRRVTISGVTYDVMADTNVTEVGSAFENEAIPTSGRNMKKMMRRAENRSGVVIAANASERDALQQIAESVEDVTLAYETADGSVYRADGWIEFESRETEENRATVTMMPRRAWASFVA